MTAGELSYEVVIATRNRPETLKASLPLIEAQTEKPRRIILVDASDDHAAFKTSLAEVIDRSPFDYLILRAERPNSSRQRNVGLDLVESEIALMPDDDSMLYPEAAAEMMAGYRLDTAGVVAGVSGRANAAAPAAPVAHRMAKSRAFKDALDPPRNYVEDRLVPDPFKEYPRELWRTRDIPAWIDGDRFALVETIGGFRMSFRTDIARRLRFDETLGYGIGYALHEDMELSLRMQSAGYLLIGAQRAAIHHNVFPAKRADGFNYGFCQIANYIYTCRRNMPETSRGWAVMGRFLRYKLLLYRLTASTPYGRDVYRGAAAAWRRRAVLMKAPPLSGLEAAYVALCDACIEGGPAERAA